MSGGFFKEQGKARVNGGRMIVCIGAACVDRSYVLRDRLEFGTSNPALRGDAAFGGVARNVAENLARLRVPVAIVTAVGADAEGDRLMQNLRDCGIDVRGVRRADARSDEYVAVLAAGGELAIGASDTRAAESLDAADLDAQWETVASAQWVFCDGNVSEALLRLCMDRRSIGSYRLAVDPVSMAKERRLPSDLHAVDALFLNEDEAFAYLAATPGSQTGLPLPEALRQRGAARAIVSRGARGAVAADASGTYEFPAVRARVVSPTGAGDALIAGVLWRLGEGDDLAGAMRAGTAAAALTIESERSVRDDLTPELVESRVAAIA